MGAHRRTLLVAVAAAASLAGCTGDDEDGGDGAADGMSSDDGTAGGNVTDDDPGTDDGDVNATDGDANATDGDANATDAADSDVEADADATVREVEHDELGSVLADGDGRTLYQYDDDGQGAEESSCTGDCAENWPPFTVETEPSPGEDVTAELTTFDREDGSTQVAAAGWPLYHYAGDGEPGDAAGQGVGGVWWVMRPDGTVQRSEGGDEAEQPA